jgi:hypothetical protein
MKEYPNSMAQIRQFPRASFPATRQNVARKVVSSTQSDVASAEVCCAYNQTRERFIATSVVAERTSIDGQEAALRNLDLNPGSGLWILPYEEIAPSSVRFPLDLVLLDSECLVLATVESFPLGGLPAPSTKPFSLLVLPADSIARGEIHPGDRLIISLPEEMKQRLQDLKEAKATLQDAKRPVVESIAPVAADDQTGAVEEQIAIFVPDAEPAEIPEVTPEVIPANAPTAQPPEQSTSHESKRWKREAEPRSWLSRLLRGEPVDPRKAPRESLGGLVAYFFTGSAPVEHAVHDISSTGIYIVTNERWYPGTLIRLTLTDRHNPTFERSITVNAMAVRSGNDGVGLKFVFEGKSHRQGKSLAQVDARTGVGRDQFEEFLRMYKTSVPE